MAELNVPALETTVHKTNQWLNDTEQALHLDSRVNAYNLLRATLHLIRDRIDVGEALDFAAQLPLLLKGVYFDGFTLHDAPKKARSDEELMIMFESEVCESITIQPNDAIAGVLSVIRKHIDRGQFEHVMGQMPGQIRNLGS
ncbi:MAG: DUF2267 domain-containing protein [Spirochaetota bacterium]